MINTRALRELASRVDAQDDALLTLQEVAFMLGYDDLSNFRRAFKRWEGVAPSAWRA